MAKEEFKLGVSTLSGGSVGNILRIINGHKIEKHYLPRALSTLALSAVSEPFRWWENIRYGNTIRNFKIEQPPVFILGHWRSGTTHLHNILCQDKQFGFVTTYHGVFPDFLLGSKWIFKNFMKAKMPEKRASDNVELSPDYPQEEEFALGNMHPYGFYNFWSFPKELKKYYAQFIAFENVGDSVIKKWNDDYIELVKKALINTNGKKFISKNPPHTGRIKKLLEIFPDAKFIHIYRNPITVFISTKKLIEATMPALQFQSIDAEEMESNVFWLYQRLMRDYLEHRSLIPKQNLIEIAFEKFEENTFEEVRKIYTTLDIPAFDVASPGFKKYIDSQKSYKKNKYKMSQKKVDRILHEWKFAMDEWNYSIPENIEIVD